MPIENFSIRPFTSEDAHWLIETNVTHYKASDGFDESFSALVAQVVWAFVETHDPAFERGWIAEEGGRSLGSIFCVNTGDTKTARLKLFYLIEEARGRGIGQALLTALIEFAAGSGREKIVLRTHESHKAAGQFYRKNGFRLSRSINKRSFGVDVVEQHFERDLT